MEYALYVVLGMFAGTVSGLFGIGGGAIVVPGLVYIFMHAHIPPAIRIHMAVGSSLAIMIFTTFAGALMHYRLGSIHWRFLKRLMPGVLVGVVLGAYLGHLLSTRLFSLIFAAFLLMVAVRMFFLVKPKTGDSTPGWLPTSIVGLAVGGKSGLFGVGGGVITTPFLVRCGLSVHNAVATSAASSFAIAVIGSVSVAISGWQSAHTVAWSVGYVYIPAFICVAIGSVTCAPIGAHFSHRLPTEKLKRLFSLLLLLVAIHFIVAGVE